MLLRQSKCECAGKTTLLDVVAGRKTQGIITGEIRLNGHVKDASVWRRISACKHWQCAEVEALHGYW